MSDLARSKISMILVVQKNISSPKTRKFRDIMDILDHDPIYSVEC